MNLKTQRSSMEYITIKPKPQVMEIEPIPEWLRKQWETRQRYINTDESELEFYIVIGFNYELLKGYSLLDILRKKLPKKWLPFIERLRRKIEAGETLKVKKFLSDETVEVNYDNKRLLEEMIMIYQILDKFQESENPADDINELMAIFNYDTFLSYINSKMTGNSLKNVVGLRTKKQTRMDLEEDGIVETFITKGIIDDVSEPVNPQKEPEIVEEDSQDSPKSSSVNKIVNRLRLQRSRGKSKGKGITTVKTTDIKKESLKKQTKTKKKSLMDSEFKLTAKELINDTEEKDVKKRRSEVKNSTWNTWEL